MLPIPPDVPGPWVHLFITSLKKGEVSRLHSLDADETWYFHQGATLDLHIFDRRSNIIILNLAGLLRVADARPNLPFLLEAFLGQFQ